MKKIILFIILSISVFSKDVNLTLGENVLNNLLVQIGDFNGTGKIDKLIKVNYSWTLSEAKIDLIPSGSKFEAKVTLITDGNDVNEGTVEGKAKFTYDKKAQNLNIEITDLKFRGLGFFNLAGFYRPTYSIPAKLFEDEEFSIKKSDIETVKIKPVLYDEDVKIFDTYLQIEGNLKFQ